MEVWAVIVAGGSGACFGAPKQFADLAGRPVLEWSIETARKACDGVVVVLPAGTPADGWDVNVAAVGGTTRSASVRAGLAAVPDEAEVIAVHDAARPLAPFDLWRAVIGAVRAGADAAVPALAVSDTVKQVHDDGHLTTLDRTSLVAVQTPQAFRGAALREAHAAGSDATDDAALVEAAGGRVELVPGDRGNIKITDPRDMAIAAALVGGRR